MSRCERGKLWISSRTLSLVSAVVPYDDAAFDPRYTVFSGRFRYEARYKKSTKSIGSRQTISSGLDRTPLSENSGGVGGESQDNADGEEEEKSGEAA